MGKRLQTRRSTLTARVDVRARQGRARPPERRDILRTKLPLPQVRLSHDFCLILFSCNNMVFPHFSPAHLLFTERIHNSRDSNYANIIHPSFHHPVSCTKIDGCNTTETCTSTTNSQCAKCKSGYYLSNGEKDNCVSCPTGNYCDGLTKKGS